MAKFFIDRPIFAWVIAIFIMVIGALSITQLPIAQYPSVAPPTIPLLPPCGTSATSSLAQRLTTAATSSVEAGDSIAAARPVYLPRQSVSHGAMVSASSV